MGVLGGVSWLRMLHGLNRTLAKKNKTKSSKGQISPLKQQTTPFPSGCMQPTDAHSRRLVPDDQAGPRPEGLARTMVEGLARSCWLISQLWLRVRLNFDDLSYLFAPRYCTVYGRPSHDRHQPLWSSQWFAYHYFCQRWPVAPGRRPEHPPSPDGHWLRTANLCCFETSRRFCIISFGPQPSRKK